MSPERGGDTRRRLLRWSWVPVAVGAALLMAALLASPSNSSPAAQTAVWLIPDWVTLLVTAALLTLALGLFWRARTDSSHRQFKTLVLLALVAAVLALMSYVPCAEGDGPIINPATWTLLLFVGEFEDGVYAAGGACAGPVPPTLLLARFLAIAVTFAAVVLSALTIWGQAMSRWWLKHRGDIDVVVGVNYLSEPLIRFLVKKKERPLVVVDDSLEGPIFNRLKPLSATFIEGDAKSPALLRDLLTRHGRRKAHWLYVVTESPRFNREVATTAKRLLIEAHGSAQASLMARIDDPREAESWRLKHAESSNWYAPPRPGDGVIIVDALCPAELTAAQIIEFLLRKQVRDVLLVGDGPLLVSLMSELVWRCGWEQTLALASRRSEGEGQAQGSGLRARSWPHMHLHSWGAGVDARAEWDVIRRRLPDDSDWAELLELEFYSADHLPGASDLAQVLGTAESSAVVFLSLADATAPETASRIARLDRNPWILVPAPDLTRFSEVDGRRHDFGLSLLKTNGLDVEPKDDGDYRWPRARWRRLAQLQHEEQRYRFQSGQEWRSLDPAKKQRNFDELRRAMNAVANQGYEWVIDAGGAEFPDLMLEQWPALGGDSEEQEKERQRVRSALARARLFGLRPVAGSRSENGGIAEAPPAEYLEE